MVPFFSWPSEDAMTSIEYRGYMITPATRLRQKPPGWTLEVHIIPTGRLLGTRRCRTGNVYNTQEEAIAGCLELGRRVVDGTAKLRSRGDSTS
jgi:hypothetical protein